MNYFTVVGVNVIVRPPFISKIKVPYVIISIVSPEFEDFKIPHNSLCKDILNLRFHDVDSEGNVIGAFNEVGKIKPISESDIKSIYKFVEKNKNVCDWIIHCEAGMSRSAGVAVALSQILNEENNPEKYIQSIYPLSMHNVDIKSKILNYGDVYEQTKY